MFVAGYPDNMDSFLRANPGLNSRFDKILQFEDYDGKELLQIADAMFVNTAIGSSFFLELVKVNVVRQLLAKVFEAYGLKGADIYVHANTKH